ncbi:L-asparaginase [Homoserinimonas aerilata]|uniref:L-asparaginase n=1 Tax=Homoserinimonas aerilata TaxID=1162970 RepID=A0A542Y1P0_9MICO|nr:asparaginase domain-containing protein [Homoserinimonas aerilata]TQL41933.1 L-asparaginase [Homoserinimonas aerilata]
MTPRRLLVGTTGGTFGMARTGAYLSAPGEGDEQLEQALAAVMLDGWEAVVEAVTPASDSADATPDTWFAIADRLHRESPGIDAVVLIHGTDTLAYTAAALSVLWPQAGIPLVITGSQIPLGMPDSDADANLSLAVTTATELAVRGESGIWVSFGGQTLPAFGVTKIDAQSPQAFASPVAERLGDSWVTPPPIELLLNDARARAGTLDSTASSSVIVVAAFPGLDGGLLERILEVRPDALVLECYGAGTFPLSDERSLAALSRAGSAGTAIVCTSRTRSGRIMLGAYESGHRLASIGAVGAGGLPTEAAVALLHLLIRSGTSATEISRIVGGQTRAD